MNGLKRIWPSLRAGIAIVLLMCMIVSPFTVYGTSGPADTGSETSSETTDTSSEPPAGTGGESSDTGSSDSGGTPSQQVDPAPTEPQEIDINKSIEQDIIYFWHKGMPPTRVDGTHYPVLLTWGNNEEYYFMTGSKTSGAISNGRTIAYKKNTPGKNSNHTDDWPFGWWARQRSYDLGDNRTSQLNFNFEALRQYGDGVSFELPNVPFMMAVEFRPTDQYFRDTAQQNENYDLYRIGKIIRRPGRNPAATGFFAIGLNNAYSATEKNTWLYSRYQATSFIAENIFGWDTVQYNAFDWYLDTYDAAEKTWISEDPIRRTVTLDNEDHTTRSRDVALDRRIWYAEYFDSTNIVHLQNFCDTVDAVTRESGNFTAQTQLRNMRSYRTNVEIGGSKSNLRMLGDTGNPRLSNLEICDQLNIYYAEPSMVSYLTKDIVVEDGMVANLDGPIVIKPDVTITVKNGGVLSVTGWVINNGAIKIENGGTMVVQNESLLQTMVTDGQPGGSVDCQGNILILSTGKMHVGGTYGLTVGSAGNSGAFSGRIVNYGTIMAENFFCYQPYSIENRGTDSSVFIGYGIEGSGYAMIRATITGSSYPAMGTVQSGIFSTRTSNDIFGEGSSRVYVNTGFFITGGGIKDPNRP